jgi:hypothetical protein
MIDAVQRKHTVERYSLLYKISGKSEFANRSFQEYSNLKVTVSLRFFAWFFHTKEDAFQRTDFVYLIFSYAESEWQPIVRSLSEK